MTRNVESELYLPEITEVERLTIRPGDRIIVHVEGPLLTPAMAAAVRDRFRAFARIPDDIPVVVMPSDMRLEVIGEPQPDDGGFPDSP